LRRGFAAFDWESDGAPSLSRLATRVLEQFEVDQKDRGLRRKEFGYMIGILLGTYPVDREC